MPRQFASDDMFLENEQTFYQESFYPMLYRKKKFSDSMTSDDTETRNDKNEDASKNYGYPPQEDKSSWIRLNTKILTLRFNPVVFFGSVLILWSVVLCSLILQDKMPFGDLLSWITEKWTWLYISSQNLWFLFIVYLYFSKYGKIKLGKDTDEPEFSTATWFTMLFACGIGIGLFYFSVYETITHYTGNNRMTRDPSIPDNTLAQMALNVTLFHWGVHGWVVYTLVGALLGIISFREGLPLTIKSCFYPLIGERIYGWIGDLVDIISVIISVWGICPSLALGAIQINSGIRYLIPSFESTIFNQVMLIWAITIFATASTVSGTHLGIRRISEFCFLLGMFIMLVVLFYRNTFYILNLYVQSIGFYFQWIIQLGFHCDAFEQEISSGGGAADRNRILKGGDYETSDGPMDWMDNWTVFYWGWWIAWCPLVGMFVAKISKGRTLREFINGTMSAPLLYTFLWMSIFGATGIQIERQAASAGLCCKPDFNLVTLNNSIETFDLSSTSLAGYNPNYVCNSTKCNDCANTAIGKLGSKATYKTLYYKFKENPKFTEVSDDAKLTRLSCRKSEEMWFDTMHTMGDLGNAMHVISLVGIVLYFVTSSDSASLVVDTLSANGDAHPPRAQRIFWALTEGASATALLVGGGRNAIVGLQSLATASGLPYTFVLTYFCLSLYRVLQVTCGDKVPNPPTFKIGVLDGFSSPKVPYFLPDIYILLKSILNIFTAPWSIAQTAAALYGPMYRIPFFSVSVVLLMFSVGLPFGMFFVDGAGSLALTAYCAWCTVVCGMRIAVRNKCGYDANVMEDVGAAFLVYPCVTLQMYEEIPQITSTKGDKTSEQKMTSWDSSSFPFEKKEHPVEQVNGNHPGYAPNDKHNVYSNPQFQTGF